MKTISVVPTVPDVLQSTTPGPSDPKPPEEPADINPALPPRRSRKLIAAIMGAVAASAILASLKFQDVKWLFDHLLPYSQSIGTAALAAMGLLYKDLKNYKHPAAAGIVLCGIFLVSGLTGLNTFRERQGKLAEKVGTEQSVGTLTTKIDQTKEQVTKNAQTTTGSLGKLTADLDDFKADVRPADLRSEMTNMKAELEKTQKALAPSPKASLLFTFPGYGNPLSAQDFVPIHEITLKATADNIVTVPLSIVNLTDTDAVQGHANFFICDLCKFAKEPEHMTKILGAPEQMRDLAINQLLAFDRFSDIALDVIVPRNAENFQVAFQYRCHTCILKKEAVPSIVHVIWP